MDVIQNSFILLFLPLQIMQNHATYDVSMGDIINLLQPTTLLGN